MNCMNVGKTITVDPQEYLDVVDEQDGELGIRKLRTEVHREGDWHREAHVFVYNHDGQLLYQLRGPHQESFPNCWDVSAGGHVEAGTDYLTSAVKELEEELGIKANTNELMEAMYWHDEIKDPVRGLINRAWRKTFLYGYDGEIQDLKLEEGKVMQARFFTEKEIMSYNEDYGKGISLIPEYKWYYKRVFDKVRNVLEQEA